MDGLKLVSVTKQKLIVFSIMFNVNRYINTCLESMGVPRALHNNKVKVLSEIAPPLSSKFVAKTQCSPTAETLIKPLTWR